jgi:hypothetical protein
MQSILGNPLSRVHLLVIINNAHRYLKLWVTPLIKHKFFLVLFNRAVFGRGVLEHARQRRSPHPLLDHLLLKVVHLVNRWAKHNNVVLSEFARLHLFRKLVYLSDLALGLHDRDHIGSRLCGLKSPLIQLHELRETLRDFKIQILLLLLDIAHSIKVYLRKFLHVVVEVTFLHQIIFNLRNNFYLVHNLDVLCLVVPGAFFLFLLRHREYALLEARGLAARRWRWTINVDHSGLGRDDTRGDRRLVCTHIVLRLDFDVL